MRACSRRAVTLSSMRRGNRGRGVDATGRSKSKEQFVPIPYPMARSDAWRSLSGTAVKVYIELRSRYNSVNNGDLSLSLDEAARLLGIGKTTAMRALAELVDKGFIWMNVKGQWYGRRATTYYVSDRPAKAGDPPRNSWRGWRRPTKPAGAKPKNSDVGTVAEPSGETCSATIPVGDSPRSA